MILKIYKMKLREDYLLTVLIFQTRNQ